MISPQLLKSFPFFGVLTEEQLMWLALAADEFILEDSEIVFEQGQPGRAIYFLVEGCVDICYTVRDAYRPSDCRSALVGQIAPGEPFGMAALIEPGLMPTAARSCGHSRIIRLEVGDLRRRFEQDPRLEAALLQQVAEAAVERLHSTRTQLAAAYT